MNLACIAALALSKFPRPVQKKQVQQQPQDETGILDEAIAFMHAGTAYHLRNLPFDIAIRGLK